MNLGKVTYNFIIPCLVFQKAIIKSPQFTHLAFILVNYIIYGENNQAVEVIILSTAFAVFLPLHGKRTEVVDVEKAIAFINGYTNIPADQKLEYIEVIVTNNNGSIIQCQFKTKAEAVDFLNKIK